MANQPSEMLQHHRESIRRIVSLHRTTNPRVFGSVLRGTDTADSDLDILVGEQYTERRVGFRAVVKAARQTAQSAIPDHPVERQIHGAAAPKVKKIAWSEDHFAS